MEIPEELVMKLVGRAMQVWPGNLLCWKVSWMTMTAPFLSWALQEWLDDRGPCQAVPEQQAQVCRQSRLAWHPRKVCIPQNKHQQTKLDGLAQEKGLLCWHRVTKGQETDKWGDDTRQRRKHEDQQRREVCAGGGRCRGTDVHPQQWWREWGRQWGKQIGRQQWINWLRVRVTCRTWAPTTVPICVFLCFCFASIVSCPQFSDSATLYYIYALYAHACLHPSVLCIYQIYYMPKSHFFSTSNINQTAGHTST